MTDETKPLSDNDLLFKIYEKVVRMEERLIASIESNSKEHDSIHQELIELKVEKEKLKDRIMSLEQEGVKLSLFWKFIVIMAPIVISGIITALYQIIVNR